MEMIQSVKNPKVQLWRSLRDAKGRKQSGSFLVEGVRLVREGQEDVYVYIDLLNEGDTEAPPEDCTVYGFSAEVTWLEEDDTVPSLTLSDGITWGSRLEDLEAAYGSPAAEHRSEEQKYTSYTYAYNYTEVLLTFTVFDEKGLTAVSMVRTP